MCSGPRPTSVEQLGDALRDLAGGASRSAAARPRSPARSCADRATRTGPGTRSAPGGRAKRDRVPDVGCRSSREVEQRTTARPSTCRCPTPPRARASRRAPTAKRHAVDRAHHSAGARREVLDHAVDLEQRRVTVSSRSRMHAAAVTRRRALAAAGTASRHRSSRERAARMERAPRREARADSGGAPGIGASAPRALVDASAPTASRPRVYGCRGDAKTSSTVPSSTTRPAYITTTRSARPATTPRSWVTSTTASPDLAPQVVEQLEDLRLRGDVERGGGLVGDEHARAVRQRHRQHHPLAHAARELVRVVAGAPRGRRDPDLARACSTARARRRRARRPTRRAP